MKNTSIIILLLIMFLGCNKNTSSDKVSDICSAHIFIYWESVENGAPIQREKDLSIDDPVDAQKLISYFPGCIHTKGSNEAGSWATYAKIIFKYKNGDTLSVITDYKRWSRNDIREYGDNSVLPGVEEYIFSLFKKENRLSSQNGVGVEPGATACRTAAAVRF